MPYAIRAGIDVRDFWNYTYGELVETLNVYKQMKDEESEQEMYKAYTVASLTAKFVNSAIQGKRLPDIYDVFPSLPKREPEFNWQAYEQQFLQFANQHNSQQRGSI